jgi:hypothetical protein
MYDVSVDSLQKWNSLGSSGLNIGDKVAIGRKRTEIVKKEEVETGGFSLFNFGKKEKTPEEKGLVKRILLGNASIDISDEDGVWAKHNSAALGEEIVFTNIKNQKVLSTKVVGNFSRNSYETADVVLSKKAAEALGIDTRQSILKIEFYSN